MDINHHFVNDILVIEIPNGNSGLISMDLDDFISHILKLQRSPSKKIAFNMSMKSYLNSSGLGELIKVKDNLMDREIDLVLINPTARVESLLNMVGVDQFINIIKSEDELT